MKASLIITANGRDTHLVNTLRCALAQRYASLDIMVIDSVASRSVIAEDFLARKKSRIRHFVVPNRSPLALYNHALSHASGDVLIFVSDHVSFAPHFVEQHMACYLNTDIGAVQGRIVSTEPSQSKRPTLSRTCQLRGYFNCPVAGPINRLGIYNFSLRRACAEQVGLFDEQMSDGLEWAAADYGIRCIKNQWRIRFEAGAELIMHGREAAANDRLRRQQRLEGQQAVVQAYFVQRHLSTWRCTMHRFQQRWQGWCDVLTQQNEAWRRAALVVDQKEIRHFSASAKRSERLSPQPH